jgi:hypothetical protein
MKTTVSTGDVIPPQPSRSTTVINAQPAVVRGFSQMFGVHPSIGALTIAVDVMVNAGGVATLETGLIPLSIGAGVVLGLITYLAQKHWYGDDDMSALTKSLAICLLSSIPCSLPNALFLPAAVIGLFRKRG